MKAKFFVILLFILSFGQSVFAQDKWKWPEDPAQRAKAQENNVLYSDALTAKNYTEAAKHLRWLLNNTPQLNESIYIKGAQVYEGLAATETDPKKLFAYQDTALAMYDLRAKYYGGEPNIMNRKGYKAYPYAQNRPELMKQMYDLYKRIVELNGNDTYPLNIQFYIAAACVKKSEGGLTDEQVLDIYEKIAAIIDFNVAKNDKNQQSWMSAREYVDKTMQTCVKVDCDFVKNNLAPKLKTTPNDVALMKKIMGAMVNGKCTSDPLFLEVTEKLTEAEPSYARYMSIGKVYLINKDYSKAIKNFDKAGNLGSSNDKAEAYMEIAEIYAVQGSKQAAKNYAQKALAVNPSKREAYTLIGNLYYTSGGECTNSNPVLARAIYIAAYEMYQKAGNATGMNNAKAQFPSMEDIFTHGMQEGQKIVTGCWVNETVTLQKR